MLSALPEMDRRHHDRCAAEEDHKKMRLPLLTCAESKKLFKNALQAVIDKFLDKCFLVTHDFKVLRRALVMACERAELNPNEIVGEAWNECRMDTDTLRAIEIRDAAAAEKAAKKNKKSPGQKNIGEKDKDGNVIDDGSTAEPASDVKKKKVS